MSAKMKNESNIALLEIERIGEMVEYFKPIALNENKLRFTNHHELEVKILDSIDNIFYAVNQLNKINVSSKMLSTFLYLKDRIQVELEDAQEFIRELNNTKNDINKTTPKRFMEPRIHKG